MNALVPSLGFVPSETTCINGGRGKRVSTIPFPERLRPMVAYGFPSASDTVARTRLFVDEASDSKLAVGLHGVFYVKEQL